MTDYLRPIPKAKEMSEITLQYFEKLSEEEMIDIFVSFGEYNIKAVQTLLTSELYRYHLYSLHTNNEWNIENLKKLTSVFSINKWTIFNKVCYIIIEPYSKIDYEKLYKLIHGWIVDEYRGQTQALTFRKNGKIWIDVITPTSKVIELEFAVKVHFHNAIETVYNQFPKYQKELSSLLHEAYTVSDPQLSHFVKWVLEDRLDYSPLVDIILDEKTQQAKVSFDFEPLSTLKDERLKNEIIAYCRFVHQEFKKKASATEDKTVNKRGPYNDSKKLGAINKFKMLITEKIESALKSNRQPKREEIINFAFEETLKTHNVKKTTLYHYLPNFEKNKIYDKAYSEIQKYLKNSNYLKNK